MTLEDLHEAARRPSFEPVRLILTTGAACDVRHPDLIMVGRRAVVIGIPNDPAGTAFDRTIKVDLLHVVGIEEPPTAPPSSNGPTA
jgi:hypothetical protein